MADKSTHDPEDNTGMIRPGPGTSGLQTGNDGELNEDELDEVSGGLGKLGPLAQFLPNPPPISPVFAPQPPPITERQMPVPPPIKG